MDKPQQIGVFAAQVVQAAMDSGLTWDETVAAFGIAAKVIADGAAQEGDGNQTDCHHLAQKRFAEGFAQNVVVTFASSDISCLAGATPEQMEAVLSNTNTKISFKH